MNITTPVCLMGPTASGKSALAMEIAKQVPCEIISVDSALVYRGMDIGTAKPTKEELAEVPHHLIDICDPSENYSAGRFFEDIKVLVPEIQQRGNLPLLVGGTMLYFHALQNGLSVLPTADERIRAQLNAKLEKLGLESLHQELLSVDSQAAKRINQNDPQRILRALEVYYISGETLTTWHDKSKATKPPFAFKNILLMPEDRALLHQRIEARFDAMLEDGFIDEVRELFERGDLHVDLPSIRAVGYKQVWQYLTGELGCEEMRSKAIIATRQLAKRQYTWLRKWSNGLSISPDSPEMPGQVLTYLSASSTPLA